MFTYWPHIGGDINQIQSTIIILEIILYKIDIYCCGNN